MTDDASDDIRPIAEASGGQSDAAAPSPDIRASADEQGGTAGDIGRGAQTSGEQLDDVGGDSDGDSDGQVSELRRSKEAGDRTIDQARRSAISQGDGPATYIERQEITYSGRRVFVQRQILENPDYVEREFETYVPVPGYGDMCDKLDAIGLLVLRGIPGSGRTATARMLFRASRCRRIGTLSVNTDDDLFYILHEHLTCPAAGAQPLMSAGDGYIIEVTGDLPAKGPLRGFAEAVRLSHARVVVLVDSATEGELPVSEFELIHSWPRSRRDVMARHLDARLRDQRGTGSEPVGECQKQILDHQVVLSRLNLAPSVHRIVEMARFLAKNVDQLPAKGVGRLVNDWDDSARSIAREILKGNAPPEKPYLIPQQQAFRIAYGVFHEQPLAYAFQTGELLLQKLTSVEVRKRPLKTRVFDRSVEALIHSKMVASTATNEDEQPRRARLVDESLILSILEVAWHEYAQLREPLTDWLDDLAGRSNPHVRVRAAQIVGLLATFDFTSVSEELIKPWAKRRAVYRYAAALAMDQIARHPPLSSAAKRRVEDWTSSNLVTEQDTAARWYGLRTDKEAVAKAVKELHSLGGRPQLRGGASIAVAMSLLFLNGNVDEVVDELGRWIGSKNPYLPHHAVRTLLILSDPRGAAKMGRTRLSDLAAADAEREMILVRMWRRALASRTVGGPAWNALREWLIEVDRHDERYPLMESMATQIFTDALTGRALFNLTLWHKRRPEVQIIARLRAQLLCSKGK